MGLYNKNFYSCNLCFESVFFTVTTFGHKIWFCRGFQGCSVKSFTSRRGIQHNDTQLIDIQDNNSILRAYL